MNFSNTDKTLNDYEDEARQAIKSRQVPLQKVCKDTSIYWFEELYIRTTLTYSSNINDVVPSASYYDSYVVHSKKHRRWKSQRVTRQRFTTILADLGYWKETRTINGTTIFIIKRARLIN